MLGRANAPVASPGPPQFPLKFLSHGHASPFPPPPFQGVPGRPVLYRGALHCAQCIARDQGLAAFYVAAVPGYLKVSGPAEALASFRFGRGVSDGAGKSTHQPTRVWENNLGHADHVRDTISNVRVTPCRPLPPSGACTIFTSCSHGVSRRLRCPKAHECLILRCIELPVFFDHVFVGALA